MTDPITVTVLSSDEQLCATLTERIESSPGLAAAVAPTVPRVALVDERLEDCESVISRLAGGGSTICVALSDGGDLERLGDLLAAGARGCVPRKAMPATLASAVMAAARGRAELPAVLLRALAKKMAAAPASEDEEAAALDRELVREVISGRLFDMVFQPIVDMRNGRVAGLEALARFTHELGHPPGVWLEMAGSAGLRIELEHALLSAATIAFADAPDEMWLAVNLSPEAAMDGRLEGILEDASVERLVLEITDHRQLDDYEPLAEALSDFRAAGLRVAVDDSGQGLSSLQQVARLAPTYMKLNRMLTRDIDRDPTKHALAYALTAFAAQIGTRLIAEGLETEGELMTLRALGAPLGQGYLLARPKPLADLALDVPLALPSATDTDAATPSGPTLDLPQPARADLREAARVVLRFLAGQHQSATFAVAHLDYARRRHTIIASRGPAMAALAPGAATALEDAPCFHMACGRGARACDDVAGDVVYAALPFTHAHDVASYLGVPLELPDGSRVGSVFAVSRAPRAFAPGDLAVLEAAASLLRGVLLRQTDGMSPGQVMRLLRDVTRLEGVSGALNAPSFVEAVAAELRRPRSRESGFYVAVELDDFAALRDRYGRTVSDLLVKEVATSLMAGLDELDAVGRLEDGRFAALLAYRHDQGSVTRVLHGLRSRLADFGRRRGITVAARAGHLRLARISDAEAAFAQAAACATPL